MIKEHYTEADLLETYYMQPGESMPVMMHLANCSDCAGRYERLERKLRELAACEAPKSEGFWAAQRDAVMARVGARQLRRPVANALRVAAAVLLVAAGIGGFVALREEPPAETIAVAPAVAVEESLPIDPWQSEELQDFKSVVQWETWIADEDANGGQAL